MRLALLASVTEVFFQVASHALEVYEIRFRFFHMDSSSFHAHSVYDPDEPEQEAIGMTHGYPGIIVPT